MSTPRLTFFSVLRAILLGSLLAVATSLSAAVGGFSATLSTDQKNSAGLTTLTPAELAELDQIIAVEVGQARKEGSTEFEGTFLARRTEDERKLAGLDRLNPAQLTKLNALVAAAVGAAPKPRERPRIKDSDVFNAAKKPEVHGEVSLTYGRSSGGGDFRAASMWVDYFDPNTGLGIGIGISQSSGKGFYGFYPDDYGYGYGYGYGPSAFYGSRFGYAGSPFRSFGAGDYYDGQGSSFRPLADFSDGYYRDYRGFRRR